MPNRTEKTKVLGWWKTKALSCHLATMIRISNSYFRNSLQYLLCKWYHVIPIELFETGTLSSPFSRWKKCKRDLFSMTWFLIFWIKTYWVKIAESSDSQFVEQWKVVGTMFPQTVPFHPAPSEVLAKLFLGYFKATYTTRMPRVWSRQLHLILCYSIFIYLPSFCKVISYFCNGIWFSCHSLHSFLGSLDLLNNFSLIFIY